MKRSKNEIIKWKPKKEKEKRDKEKREWNNKKLGERQKFCERIDWNA